MTDNNKDEETITKTNSFLVFVILYGVTFKDKKY